MSKKTLVQQTLKSLAYESLRNAGFQRLHRLPKRWEMWERPGERIVTRVFAFPERIYRGTTLLLPMSERRIERLQESLPASGYPTYT